MKNTRQKGRKMVLHVLGIIRRELDPTAYEVVGSGSGKDKGDIYAPQFNHVFEIKNQKQISVQQWLHEAQADALHRGWAVAWRDPQSPEHDPRLWVALPFADYLGLLVRNASPEPLAGKEVRYHLSRAIQHLRRVVKLEP